MRGDVGAEQDGGGGDGGVAVAGVEDALAGGEADARAEGRVAEEGLECVGEGHGVAGRDEDSIDIVGDELGCAAAPSGDDGELGGHGGWDGGREGVCQRGDDEEVGQGEVVTLLRGGERAGEVDGFGKAEGLGERAEEEGLRAVVGDGDVEGMAAAGEDGGGFQQDGEAGVGKVRHEGEHLHGNGDGAWGARGVEGCVDAVTGEVDARPNGGGRVAQKLGACGVGAGEREGGLGELAAQVVAARVEELGRSLDGERVGDAQGAGGDASGGGDVAGAFDVEVGEGTAAEPVGEDEAVHEIEPCMEELDEVEAGASEGGDERTQEDERSCEERAQEDDNVVQDDAREVEQRGMRQNDEGGGGLGCFGGGERKRRVRRAEGGRLNDEAVAAESGDLVEGSRVKGGWVTGEQITEAGRGVGVVLWHEERRRWP